ncbi:MAG: PilZ domain-containing protein [Rhodospirillaceae bacterium]|nr:PilZ domain-containing protein [Rhodospirillaceae bacterium]MBT7955488.1 PilZ domain-containing protein [Rhodospirillaceae bacterium]
MSEQSDFAEKRRHKRHKVPNSVKAKINDQEVEATLLDVSAGGAALDMQRDVKPDDPIELMIDDVGEISATVSRSLDDGVAVRFMDIDDDEEEMLLADLERIDIDIRNEDF